MINASDMVDFFECEAFRMSECSKVVWRGSSDMVFFPHVTVFCRVFSTVRLIFGVLMSAYFILKHCSTDVFTLVGVE